MYYKFSYELQILKIKFFGRFRKPISDDLLTSNYVLDNNIPEENVGKEKLIPTTKYEQGRRTIFPFQFSQEFGGLVMIPPPYTYGPGS